MSKTRGFAGDLEAAKVYYYTLSEKYKSHIRLTKKEYIMLQQLKKDITNAEKRINETRPI